MNKMLTISEELYNQLESTSRHYGYDNVEQMLAALLLKQDELRQRQETASQIDILREQLLVKYGKMPDSTDLIREDRAR
ncbi:MAG: hypothetical protein M1546_11865 [Chloroflexi bacterium]|nr:hypothetical protein [Chloroflexota bacterium]